jgi:transcription termination factor Rho
MNEKMVQFKLRCKDFLSQYDIGRLRIYGRMIGVDSPTKKNKGPLIDEIIAILSFELAPIEISKQGAPVKNNNLDETIPNGIKAIKDDCFKNDIMMDTPKYDFEAEYQKMLADITPMRVADPQEEKRGFVSKLVSRGQVAYVNGEWILLPLDGSEPESKIPIPDEIVKEGDLREGDVITCHYREKDGKQWVGVLLTVNEVFVQDLKERAHFDECAACYSKESIRIYDENNYASSIHKYVEWMLPIRKGQRGCVISAPKAGKTTVLKKIVEAAQALNRQLVVFTLLVDESHETVGEFRRNSRLNSVFYSTYEDDADRQVFVADFVLKRAKRFAEMGKDVLIVIDSLNALASAFNNTQASLGGKTLASGLESKTIHYLKKYFGAARCLEKGGSITIVGAISIGTGDPADETIARELSSLATMQLCLSEELAVKRIYPAIDFMKAFSKSEGYPQDENITETEFLLRNRVMPVVGAEGVIKLLRENDNKEDFMQAIKAF